MGGTSMVPSTPRKVFFGPKPGLSKGDANGNEYDSDSGEPPHILKKHLHILPTYIKDGDVIRAS